MFRSDSDATLEQRLAYAMLLLELEQWPPVELPSETTLAEKLERLREGPRDWAAAFTEELQAKIRRNDIRAFSLKRLLLTKRGTT